VETNCTYDERNCGDCSVWITLSLKYIGGYRKGIWPKLLEKSYLALVPSNHLIRGIHDVKGVIIYHCQCQVSKVDTEPWNENTRLSTWSQVMHTEHESAASVPVDRVM